PVHAFIAISSRKRALWRAHLAQALVDASDSRSAVGCNTPRTRARETLRQEARAWFASDDLFVGGFRFTCELLDLDPAAARRAVGGGEVTVGEAVRAAWGHGPPPSTGTPAAQHRSGVAIGRAHGPLAAELVPPLHGPNRPSTTPPLVFSQPRHV